MEGWTIVALVFAVLTLVTGWVGPALVVLAVESGERGAAFREELLWTAAGATLFPAVLTFTFAWVGESAVRRSEGHLTGAGLAKAASLLAIITLVLSTLLIAAIYIRYSGRPAA